MPHRLEILDGMHSKFMQALFDRTIQRIRRSWSEKGASATVFAGIEAVLSPIVRLRRRLVFVARACGSEPVQWRPDERLLIVGPDSIDSLGNGLAAALRTEDQREDLEGVRHSGNRVFILADEAGYLHRGYVRLANAGSHDSKAVFFGDLRTVPEIRCCETAERARGRGLYRRVLNEQLRYLQTLGHQRATLYIMAENVPSIKGATAAGFELFRTLSDWIVFRSLVIQKVQESGTVRWRAFWQ